MAIGEAHYIAGPQVGADDARHAFDWASGEGVDGSGDLAVTPGAGRQMLVATGRGLVAEDGRTPALYYLVENVSPTSTDDATGFPDGGIPGPEANPRIDRIVAQVHDPPLAGNRTWSLKVLKGAPTAGLTTPAVTTGAQAVPSDAIALARFLTRASGVFSGSYVLADIVDERASARSSSGAGASPQALVYRNSNQVVPSSAPVAISFTTERYDSSDMWVVGQPTRLTAPSAGLYLVTGSVYLAVSATGYLRINGTSLIAAQSGVFIALSRLWRFAAGDYVELIAFQTTGVAQNATYGADYSPELAIARISG